jgi:F-type H+-transporting ATPase subunit epsilon
MILFELVTLDGIKFRKEVYEVQLPTPNGKIGIFKNHSPLVSIASPGIISIRHKQNEPDDMQEFIATKGGVIEITEDTVRMLVDEADREDEINEKEIKEAHERALKLRAEAKDELSLQHAQTMIERTGTQLKVAELRRNRRNRRS